MINYLFIEELETGTGAGEPEPELVDKCLIAPEREPELVLFFSGSPALVCFVFMYLFVNVIVKVMICGDLFCWQV